MCGIAGIVSFSNPIRDVREVLNRMRHTLGHRGPDGHGVHIAPNQGFLNVRLAVIDRSGGAQPMYSADGSKGIVFNGEIFNYRALRKELELQGAEFLTLSDTEVVLRLFEREGIECLEKLNGMFSLCVWDDTTEEVYLARDQLGIKPLYIYQDSQTLVFASELKAILAIPGLDLTWDPHGFQDYLTFRYMQAPLTCFREIRRLEAGTYLRIHKGSTSHWPFYDREYAPQNYESLHELQEHANQLLKNAVQSQLMGEVPIGLFLSGGLDSSAIAAYIAELGVNLTTFNIGFPDVHEFEHSRVVANYFGLQHIEIETTPAELLTQFDAIVSALDEPIADPACFPLYWLCHTVKQHVTVVLSGEGSDEIFGGYPQYQSSHYRNLLPTDTFNHFLERSYYFLDAQSYLHNPREVSPIHMRNKKYFEGQDPLNAMLSFDMKTWLPDNLMMKADKMTMAHSLEGRFPFLDLPLVEFSCRLPEAAKIHPDGTGKWLLRKIMHNRLPQQILDRPKMGFSVPLHHLLEGIKERVLAACYDTSLESLWSILNKTAVLRTIQGYFLKEHSETLRAWTLSILVLWCQQSQRSRVR